MALRYKLKGRGFDSRWGHWVLHWRNPSGRTLAVGSTQLLTKTHTTHRRQTSIPRHGSNPQSQQANDRRLAPGPRVFADQRIPDLKCTMLVINAGLNLDELVVDVKSDCRFNFIELKYENTTDGMYW